MAQLAFTQTASFCPPSLDAAPPRSIMERRCFLSVESLSEAGFPQRQNVFGAFFFKTHTRAGRLGTRLSHQSASFHFYCLRF